jgi:uroporphyrinogen decarboxylase
MPKQKPFLNVLRGRSSAVPPIWLMRQAGRYLPEYRRLRAEAGSFQAMIADPRLATEVTLQPIRRFGFDAAILFSDILVIPAALGQKVSFEDGRGPVLEPLKSFEDLETESLHSNLQPVYEAVSSIKTMLDQEGYERTALIGFAGAPWTLACYMVDGGGSKEFSATRSLAYRDPEAFSLLIGLLTSATIEYLSRQIEAGAEAVQLFDSWAGLLPADQFRLWVMEPARKIVEALNRAHPDIPVIGFPRGAGSLYEGYAQVSKVTALGLDERVSLDWARGLGIPVQGNLDPFALLAGGEALDRGVDRVMEGLSGVPFVFNLGHGVHKDTPPEHVMQLVNRVRNKC